MTDRHFSVLAEPEIERAIEELIDTCDQAAELFAEREYRREYLKSVKALMIMESDEKSATMKEAEALASTLYDKELKAYKHAILEAEKIKARRAALELQVEAWRTLQANRRAVR